MPVALALYLGVRVAYLYVRFLLKVSTWSGYGRLRYLTFSKEMAALHGRLKRALIDTITKVYCKCFGSSAISILQEFTRTGYLWEHYDDRSGKVQRFGGSLFT